MDDIKFNNLGKKGLAPINPLSPNINPSVNSQGSINLGNSFQQPNPQQPVQQPVQQSPFSAEPINSTQSSQPEPKVVIEEPSPDQKSPKDWMGVFFKALIIIAIFGLAFYFTGPTIAQAAIAKYQGGDVGAAADDVTYGGKNALSKLIDNFKLSWKKNEQIYKGDYVEGKQTKTKEFVGVEWLNPWTPNPAKYFIPSPIDIDSRESIEFRSRVHGFGYDEDIVTMVTCHVVRRSIFKKSPGTFQRLDDATVSPVFPEVITAASNFDEERTCYPQNITCPEAYLVYFTALSEGFVTRAELQNAYIEKNFLEEKLKVYARDKELTLDNENEVIAALKDMYPEVAHLDGISESDKAPIKLIIQTEKMPLIGIDTGTGSFGGIGSQNNQIASKKLKIQVSVENMVEGTVDTVHALKVVIPDGFGVAKPNQIGGVQVDFCSGWTAKEENGRNVLYLNNPEKYEFYELEHTLQKSMPSCHLEILDPKKVLRLPNEPNDVLILAEIEYEYGTQKEYKLDVRPKDNDDSKKDYVWCAKQKTKKTSSTTVTLPASSESESQSESTGSMGSMVGKPA